MGHLTWSGPSLGLDADLILLHALSLDRTQCYSAHFDSNESHKLAESTAMSCPRRAISIAPIIFLIWAKRKKYLDDKSFLPCSRWENIATFSSLYLWSIDPFSLFFLYVLILIVPY